MPDHEDSTTPPADAAPDDVPGADEAATATAPGPTALMAAAGDPATGHLLAGLDARVPRWIVRLVVALVVGVAVIYIAGIAVSKLRDLLIATVAALFVSFALEPAVNFLVRHGWKRWVATIVVVFSVLILLGVFIASMVPLIIDQVQQLIADVPSWIDRITRLAERILNRQIDSQWIAQQIGKLDTRIADFGTSLARNLLGVGMQLFKVVFFGFTMLFFTFYFVADAPRLRRWICSMMRPDRQRRVLWAWETAINRTGGYIYSRLIMGVISAICMYIVLLILGVPFPVPLALWMGIFSQLIPTIGTYIAAALPLFVALLYRPLTALILLIYVVVYQIVENYTLAPKISARTMQLHAGIAFAATIAGASLFGVIGAFLALPVAAILQAGVTTYAGRHEVLDTRLTEHDDHDDTAVAGGPNGETGRGGLRGRLARTAGRVRRKKPPDGPPDGGPAAG
jgi:predicted PurR-regulated permease PerM